MLRDAVKEQQRHLKGRSHIRPVGLKLDMRDKASACNIRPQMMTKGISCLGMQSMVEDAGMQVQPPSPRCPQPPSPRCHREENVSLSGMEGGHHPSAVPRSPPIAALAFDSLSYSAITPSAASTSTQPLGSSTRRDYLAHSLSLGNGHIVSPRSAAEKSVPPTAKLHAATRKDTRDARKINDTAVQLKSFMIPTAASRSASNESPRTAESLPKRGRPTPRTNMTRFSSAPRVSRMNIIDSRPASQPPSRHASRAASPSSSRPPSQPVSQPSSQPPSRPPSRGRSDDSGAAKSSPASRSVSASSTDRRRLAKALGPGARPGKTTSTLSRQTLTEGVKKNGTETRQGQFPSVHRPALDKLLDYRSPSPAADRERSKGMQALLDLKGSMKSDSRSSPPLKPSSFGSATRFDASSGHRAGCHTASWL